MRLAAVWTALLAMPRSAWHKLCRSRPSRPHKPRHLRPHSHESGQQHQLQLAEQWQASHEGQQTSVAVRGPPRGIVSPTVPFFRSIQGSTTSELALDRGDSDSGAGCLPQYWRFAPLIRASRALEDEYGWMHGSWSGEGDTASINVHEIFCTSQETIFDMVKAEWAAIERGRAQQSKLPALSDEERSADTITSAHGVPVSPIALLHSAVSGNSAVLPHSSRDADHVLQRAEETHGTNDMPRFHEAPCGMAPHAVGVHQHSTPREPTSGSATSPPCHMSLTPSAPAPVPVVAPVSAPLSAPIFQRLGELFGGGTPSSSCMPSHPHVPPDAALLASVGTTTAPQMQPRLSPGLNASLREAPTKTRSSEAASAPASGPPSVGVDAVPSSRPLAAARAPRTSHPAERFDGQMRAAQAGNGRQHSPADGSGGGDRSGCDGRGSRIGRVGSSGMRGTMGGSTLASTAEATCMSAQGGGLHVWCLASLAESRVAYVSGSRRAGPAVVAELGTGGSASHREHVASAAVDAVPATALSA